MAIWEIHWYHAHHRHRNVIRIAIAMKTVYFAPISADRLKTVLAVKPASVVDVVRNVTQELAQQVNYVKMEHVWRAVGPMQIVLENGRALTENVLTHVPVLQLAERMPFAR